MVSGEAYRALLYIHDVEARRKAETLRKNIQEAGHSKKDVYKIMGCALRWCYEMEKEPLGISFEGIKGYVKKLKEKYSLVRARQHVSRLVQFHNWLVELGHIPQGRILTTREILSRETAPVSKAFVTGKIFWSGLYPPVIEFCQKSILRRSKYAVVSRNEIYVLRWALAKLGFEDPPTIRIVDLNENHIVILAESLHAEGFSSETIYHLMEHLEQIWDLVGEKHGIRENPVKKAQEKVGLILLSKNEPQEPVSGCKDILLSAKAAG